MRYAITDLKSASQGLATHHREQRRTQWLYALRRWEREGLDFVQLREKTLDGGEMLELVRAGIMLLDAAGLPHRPKLLVNGRPDVALAGKADGIHLSTREGELRPEQIRALFRRAGAGACVISRSCHTVIEVEHARAAGCDLVLFGPVFGKTVNGQQIQEGGGLMALKTACLQAGPVPVLALGGVTPANTAACKEVGAAGVAGIRLFSAGLTPP